VFLEQKGNFGRGKIAFLQAFPGEGSALLPFVSFKVRRQQADEPPLFLR